MNEQEATEKLQSTLKEIEENGWGVKIMPQYAFEIVPQAFHKKVEDKRGYKK